MRRRKGRVRYYLDGQHIKQKNPAGLLFWLLYLSWLGKPLRGLLATGLANRIARWWYTSRLSSWSIRPFIRRHKIDKSEFVQPVKSFTSFNDFFIRKLKKDARPIDKTPLGIVSPADGTAFVIPHLQPTNTFYIKQKPFDLATFVGGAERAAAYQHGVLLIVRLAPHDYHRFHMPIAGYITDHGPVAGRYESVNPRAFWHCMPLMENKRHVFEVHTPAQQKLLMVAVGALCAGSIVPTYNKQRNYLTKGSEVGYFAFGGSTVALIAPPGSIQLRTDMLAHSGQGYETAIDMGQQIAQWQ